ncbi:hypothetical protein [Methanothermobacter thermautotrophicus]|uniref:hypothetical protein n=1 Tax=Methanothermobacter thermautotrophicus TaxID=145262 RepID=UPI00186800A0|nr:hypothetical protein [Methanothermobacter thermautotrophicus]
MILKTRLAGSWINMSIKKNKEGQESLRGRIKGNPKTMVEALKTERQNMTTAGHHKRNMISKKDMGGG